MPQANLVLNITIKDLPTRLLKYLVVVGNNSIGARDLEVS